MSKVPMRAECCQTCWYWKVSGRTIVGGAQSEVECFSEDCKCSRRNTYTEWRGWCDLYTHFDAAIRWSPPGFTYRPDPKTMRTFCETVIDTLQEQIDQCRAEVRAEQREKSEAKNKQLKKTCSRCGGRGDEVCPDCNGTGVGKCSDCEGAGGFAVQLKMQEEYKKITKTMYDVPDSTLNFKFYGFADVGDGWGGVWNSFDKYQGRQILLDSSVDRKITDGSCAKVMEALPRAREEIEAIDNLAEGTKEKVLEDFDAACSGIESEIEKWADENKAESSPRIKEASVLIAQAKSVVRVSVKDAFGLEHQALINLTNGRVHLYARNGELCSLPSTQQERFKMYMDLAIAGAVDAMIAVAHCYQIGYGCEKSEEEAVAWNRKAAELGNPEAQLQMGIAYLCGDGVEQDLKKAFDWYMKSAMQGNANAQNYIGGAYADGDGVDVDKKVAVEWLWKAAEQNQTAAIETLRELGGRGLDEFLEYLDPDADNGEWWKFQKMVSDVQRGDVQSIYDLGDALFYGFSGVKENERASIVWYEKAADKGHSAAARKMGNFYRDGELVEKDGNAAFGYYKIGADGGDEDSLYALGRAYYFGEGVERNPVEAMACFDRLSEDSAHAKEIKSYRGECYEHGWGVEKDEDRAGELYAEAAEGDDPRGCYNYARCLEDGLCGIEDDLDKAFSYYEKAAEDSDSIEHYNGEAHYRIGLFYHNGWSVDEDEEEALKWFRESAEYGNADALFHVGTAYYAGRGVKKDKTEAFKWLIQSAEKGHAKAQRFVGTSYRRGFGVEKNLDLAFSWYLKAAEQGDAGGQYWAGKCYAEGWGTSKDIVVARVWYEKAAAQEDTDAICALGWIYQLGKGVDVDAAKAAEWFEKGVNLDNGTCMNNLARLFEDGNGVAQNFAKARELLEKAVQNNCNRAYYHLGRFYENGLGVAVDIELAKKYYAKVADEDEDARAALERLS